MSNYNEQIQQNNDRLESLIDTANALPEAGSGGGSDSLIQNKLNGAEIDATSLNSNESKIIYTYETSKPIHKCWLGAYGMGLYDNATLQSTSDNSGFKPVHTASAVSRVIYTSHDNILNINLSTTDGDYVGIDNSGLFIMVLTAENEIDFDYFEMTYKMFQCYAKNTPITLADGSTKLVQDITYGDDLLVWDFDNGCYATAKPLWIKRPKTATYYYLCKFDNGTELKLVGSNGKCHRVFSIDDGRFESATDCVGKMVMTEQGATKLASCERVDEEVEFYNIITNYHINLFANSVLTSCRLNNIYPIEDMKFVKEDRDLTLFEAFENVDINFYKGLRLAEQTYSVDEIEKYVSNLYRLMA